MTLPRLTDPEVPPHARVLSRADRWAQLNDPYVARVAQRGLLLDWLEGFQPLDPDPKFCPPWWSSSPDLPPEIGKLVQQWVKAGVVIEVQPDEVHCASSIFAIPKQDSEELRLITNLKNVNPFLSTTPFKLPTLQNILPFLKKGMYATKIDIKSAYHHWPIAARDKNFLVFEYQGKYYQHQSLPFGLSVAPREWQRAMEAVVKVLREEGATIWVYLDDFLLIGQDTDEVQFYTIRLLELLADLGIEVNYPKSVVKPVQVLQYLGFILDLMEGRVDVPPHKLANTLQKLTQLANNPQPTLRQVTSILGKVRSLLFAVPQAKLLTDQMVWLLQKNHNIPWETKVHIPQAVLSQIEVAIGELKLWKGRKFSLPLPQAKLYTDASDQGWGATVDFHPQAHPAYGWFIGPQAQLHINVKEGEAAHQALLVYGLRDTHIHLYTDNTTLWWYIHKWGGRSPEMNSVVRKIWHLCQEKNIQLTPHYIPSLENPADMPSRMAMHPLVHSSLCPQVMELIQHTFQSAKGDFIPKPFTPKWDWMATERNAVCHNFVGEDTNFFTQDLQAISPGWINPPTISFPEC